MKNINEGLKKTSLSHRFGLHGVDWVIDTVDPSAFLRLRPLFDKVRMKAERGVMVSTSLSGSAAYSGRLNPYPGDVDFDEIVIVKSKDLESAARTFTRCLLKNIESILTDGTIRFSEMKLGSDPSTGKGLKWSLDDLRKGESSSGVSLNEAVLHRGMIKLDLIGQVGGNWKEITKVLRFAILPAGPLKRKRLILLTPANLGETIYLEVFYRRKEARLAAFVGKASKDGGFSDPRVVKKYRDLMDVEIAHYGALGAAERESHLKLLKRWFNKLRMDRDREGIERLALIFGSGVNAVNEVREIMRVLALGISKNLFAPSEVREQLCLLGIFFGEREELRNEGVCDCRGEIFDAMSRAAGGDAPGAVGLLSSLADRLNTCVEESSKKLLISEFIKPYAARLGVTLAEGSSMFARNIFDKIEKGDKMCFLVQNYLRDDPRVALRIYRRGRAIITAGGRASSCYIILKGTAAVVDRTPAAGPRHIRDAVPNMLVGEIALIHEKGLRTADVIAKTAVAALEIPRDVFLELMEDKRFLLFVGFLGTDRLREEEAWRKTAETSK